MSTNPKPKNRMGKKKGDKCPSTVALRLRFAEEYVIDRNATKAAERVGVSPKSSRTTGWRWLQNAEVAAYIAELGQQQTEKAGVTSEWIINKLKNIASFDIRLAYRKNGTLVPITSLDDVTAESVAGMEVIEQSEGVMVDGDGNPVAVVPKLKKYKVLDKIAALKLLAQIKGMLVEKVDAKVTSDQPIIVKITSKRGQK
ncbi:terminase small subunit [Mesoterricola silvestris]|uniref:Terminase small subunit n=1 Tax=Mesoterricola silvestris TaxID=2927979 RepID=A0AA48GXV9_9BACT|nr:terminase small subunit [Mesoterricola silvestris]BDU72373.1 hypothetical protein METEAL_15470 [Mesoterricola silvestris]